MVGGVGVRERLKMEKHEEVGAKGEGGSGAVVASEVLERM